MFARFLKIHELVDRGHVLQKSLPRTWIVIGLALVLLSGCAERQMSASEADALYRKRFLALQSGHLAANYDPLESIPGARHEIPLTAAEPVDRTIDAMAMARARDYAAVNGSTAFLVWRNGSLEESSYFNGMSRTSAVNSLSLAKPLSVIAVGRALKLGKIKSLDAPVSDYIGEWRSTPKAAMTIRELLQMRSGLLPQALNNDPANILNVAYLHPYHARVLINDYPLTDPPGMRYAYSNANAELVAILIERATGLRYARFLSDQVLAPLDALGGTLWIDRPNGLAHSGCCIQLPPETWLRLGILLLQHGTWRGNALLSREFVAAMIMPTAQNPHAGMGVYIAGAYVSRRGFGGTNQPGPEILHGEPYLASDLALFDGNADQVLYIIPSANLVALRVGTAPPKQPEWDNAIIPNLLLRGIDWHGTPPAPQR